ncbi:hypothetical protein CU669_02150 [Paramagnetospirillum kuznetsovii]|uniref:histidine kinase n=1 Tax=Paramagnetospirillum kuznetsovii TaxID=2053833 RepID=A0A364P406_9PROT|nr:ATP-binding protein [Paramagnetospirillum kuznetsovii]RAU23897.1 hypothetical protein CU669_02150 [Paramagnetospirillum kuznetsovii]
MPQKVDLSEVMAIGGDVCAREPIHCPAQIQHHGFLIGLDRHTLAPVTRSANLDSAFHPPPAVLTACASFDPDGPNERVVVATLPDLGEVEFHCFLGGSVIFVEFERVPPEVGPAAVPVILDEAMTRMLVIADLVELSAEVAATVRQVSGFERILVYRFDEDGSGDVVGESLVADWTQSLLGLRFPSSDIPAQARALYQRTRDRWVPMRDYQPVDLVPPVAGDGKPFDLSFSRYRSVSAIHRLYQKNIGVDGAMSVSILRDGRLWGLLIGHHRRPHVVGPSTRRQVVALAQSFAMRLDALLSVEERCAHERDMRTYSAMLRKLAGADDFLTALTEGTPNIVDLLPGCCGAAVVWDDDHGAVHVKTVGTTPPDGRIAALTQWIRSVGEAPVFATDCLSARYSDFSAYCDIASGVLASFFDDSRHPALLLFRPELIRSVAWAGKPEKVAGPDGVLNLPRHSFDRWVEIKRGHSQPWLGWELDIAATIATTVSEVIIRQMRRIHDLDAEVERFSQALNLSSTTLYHQDRDLRYIWVHNPHIGFATKVVGLTDPDLYPSELAEVLVAIKRRVMASGEGERVALPSRRDDSDAEWFDLSVEPLRGGDGQIAGVSCAAVKITQYIRTEAALRRSEALLREVQQIAHLGHYVYDFAQDRWESSPTLDSILGIGPDFVRDSAHGFLLAAPGTEAETKGLLERLATGVVDHFDMNFRIRRHDDGAERWVASIGHVECDPVGRPQRLIGSIHDVHDRIEAEQRLRDTHRELERSNAELKQFAYVASHDLRQPLRTITSFLGLLVRKLGPQVDGEVREFVDFVQAAARRMDRLIVDLLEYSKVGHDRVPPGPVNLEEVVGECLHALEAARAESGGGIAIVNFLPVVKGYRGELVRLFQNLIGNALKYRDPERRLDVEIGCARNADAWEVSISDNGIGIAAADYDRAFGVFQRLTGSDGYEGTGIGLSICKKIVEHHGGQIWIESEVGVGSRFRFTLPPVTEDRA